MRPAIRQILLGGRPGWVMPGASVDLDFANGRYYGGSLDALVSLSRASSATSLLPTSAAAASYLTFASGMPAIVRGLGQLIYEARTNLLLNSTAPVTQTTGSLATGTYTLWVNGSGSAAVSAGTATITGAGTATNGSPVTFVVTVAGTVTVTKTGSLNAFQLELGSFGTPLIATAGASAARAADIPQLIGPALTAALNAKAAFFQTNGVQFGANVPGLIGWLPGSAFSWYPTSNQSLLRNDGLNTATASFGTGTAAGTVKTALAMDGAGFSIVSNGGTKATSASAWGIGSANAVYLGNRSTGDRALNGYLQRFALSSIKGAFDGMTV